MRNDMLAEYIADFIHKIDKQIIGNFFEENVLFACDVRLQDGEVKAKHLCIGSSNLYGWLERDTVKIGTWQHSNVLDDLAQKILVGKKTIEREVGRAFDKTECFIVGNIGKSIFFEYMLFISTLSCAPFI